MVVATVGAMVGSAMQAGDLSLLTLDPAFAQRAPARFDRLLEGFADGYRNTFGGDEAEPPSLWRARIRGAPRPEPVLRIALMVDAQDGVRGGAAAELYRDSACVLATYLYVLDRPGQRHRGHGRALLRAALDACAAVTAPRALLAEVEWPPLLAAAGATDDAVAAARTRLGFFSRLGAQVLNFDYVQPALAPGQAPATWLRLLLLPDLGTGLAGDALRSSLRAFLQEFHRAVGAQSGHGVDPAALAAQCAALDHAAPLARSIEPVPG
jgi:hypothetical protein